MKIIKNNNNNCNLILKNIKINNRKYSSNTTNNLKEIIKNNSSSFHNIPNLIEDKIGLNLHKKQNHPLNIIKNKIENYCNEYATKNKQSSFLIHDNEIPITNTKNCFDDLLVPVDHISRSRSDTYYINETMVNKLFLFISVLFLFILIFIKYSY